MNIVGVGGIAEPGPEMRLVLAYGLEDLILHVENVETGPEGKTQGLRFLLGQLGRIKENCSTSANFEESQQSQ